MKKSSRVISTLLLGATLTSFSTGVFAVESKEVVQDKLAGATRYETNLAVSAKWDKADTVVLVNSYGIADALAATPLAKKEGAPILLTEGDKLTSSTAKEIERLGAKKAIIVGGDGVVSKDVINDLEAMKLSVERLGGQTRYETSAAVVKAMGNVEKVAVVNGYGLADALSVAAPAASNDMAIVLASKDALNNSEDVVKNAKEKYVIGGEGVVSESLAKEIGAERLGGATRGETNAEVLEKFYANEELDKIYVAKDGNPNETELVDALGAGALAGKENNPVVLAGAALSAGQEAYLKARTANAVVEVGNGINTNTVESIVKALEVKDVPPVEEGNAVEKVMEITKTGITVVLQKVTEAKENFTIEVKDPNGKVIEVKPVNLEIGDAEITFEFKNALTEKPASGIWTIGGVEFDQAAVDAVDAVKNAANQVELLKALKSSYFSNVKDELIEEYETDIKAGDVNTIADIQKIIDDVNAKNVTDAEQAEAVKAVTEAGNQVELLKALKNPLFTRVNDTWIAEYDGSTIKSKATVAEMQTEIDTVNNTKVEAAKDAAIAGLDNLKVAEAKQLVVSYIKDDVEPSTAKQDMMKELDVHDAVINVTLANTNAKLEKALNSLATVVNDESEFNMNTVNGKELTRYRSIITETAADDKNEVSEIAGLISNGNIAAETDTVAKIKAITKADEKFSVTNEEFKNLLVELADRAAFVNKTNPAFTMEVVNDNMLTEYMDAIIAASDKTTSAHINTIIVTVNNPETELEAVKDASDADALLIALKGKTLGLNNVIDANKDEYVKEDFDALVDTTDTDTTVASVKAIKELVSQVNAKVEVNKATTAQEMKVAVTNFAIAKGETTFIDLSSEAKADLAAIMLEGRAEAGYDKIANVSSDITAKKTVMTDKIAAVNTAATNSAMVTALTALNNENFTALEEAKKIDVAEAFINASKDEENNRVSYETITSINAKLNQVIAQ